MKVGIITFYYNSVNYGGNLQAFALCEAIKQHTGYDVEQISYDMSSSVSNANGIKPVIKNILRTPLRILRKVRTYFENFGINTKLKIRKKAFNGFNKNIIEHSKKIYTKKNICQCIDNYDIFVAGSDQIWNPMWSDFVYRLEFVPSNKKKIAYAVSLGRKYLSYGEEDMFENCMRDFDAISVREQQSIELLKDFSPVDIEWALDPTLLLDSYDWDKIVTERKVKGDYVFCYFLGDDINQRRLAKEISKKRNIKIVTLPNIMGKKRKCDMDFGDIKLYDVSPSDFVSLIKNASFVITDSFHATVFSYIYKKEFVVLERTEYKAMSTRISSLMKLIGLNDRFLNTEEKSTLAYIEDLSKINYESYSEEFINARKSSIEFLKNNLIGNK